MFVSRTARICSIMFCLAIVASQPVSADGESGLETKLYLYTGIYAPTLNTSLHISPYDNSFSASAVLEGNNDKAALYGFGLTSDIQTGIQAGFGVYYQPRRRMAYTSYSIYGKVEPERPDTMWFEYSTFTGWISLTKYLFNTSKYVRWYAGCGVAATFITHQSRSAELRIEDAFGFSGYPVVRADVFINKNIGIFAQLQYHLGRTVSRRFQTIDEYNFSLNGPEFRIGLTI